MKLLSIVKVSVLALPLVLASCGSHKKVVQEPVKMTPEVRDKVQFLESVKEQAQTGKFLTSKVKFSVEVGPQKLTLTGNLKMKRDDVIRLQLMAFGFVEAGRIEMTKDYVLIMDRINKQYLKAPWMSVDFLRNSGLNFNTIQALFWNELFLPGESKVTDEGLKNFETIPVDNDFVIRLDKDQMSYSWLAEQDQALIKMANVLHKDRFDGNTQLNWNYSDFENVGKKQFPTRMHVTLTSPKKEVSLGLRAIIPEKEVENKLDIKRIPKDELPGLIKQLSSEMQLAAANLEFERAALLRDEIEKIKAYLG